MRAWKALVAKGPLLAADTTVGDPISRDRWPRAMQSLPNLARLELPGAFRALYTVVHVPGEGKVINIEWVGDHKEYDRLFGYSTS